MSIEFKDVHASLSKAQILKGVSLIAEDGLITGIVGPNGCGKSTLIKTVFHRSHVLRRDSIGWTKRKEHPRSRYC